MIRELLLLLPLVGAMSAQATHALKVRVVFPEGLTEKASMTYIQIDVEGNSHRYYGASFRKAPFVEVPSTTGRFRALVWAPGCKMKHFDVPVEKSDIELQFPCDKLNTVSFHGRVKGVDVGDSAKISVSYESVGTCIWLQDPDWKNSKKGFCCNCGGPQIGPIASAAVAPDGAFRIELPDFAADPIVSDDGSAELEFWIGGLKGHYILEAQSSGGIETKAMSIGVAPSYPSEVTFLAVPF